MPSAIKNRLGGKRRKENKTLLDRVASERKSRSTRSGMVAVFGAKLCAGDLTR